MPSDTLAEEAQAELKAANQVLRSKRVDADARHQSVMRLKNLDDRLCNDAETRQNDYVIELQEKEDAEINAKSAQLNNNQKYVRANVEQKARDHSCQTASRVHKHQLENSQTNSEIAPDLSQKPD